MYSIYNYHDAPLENSKAHLKLTFITITMLANKPKVIPYWF